MSKAIMWKYDRGELGLFYPKEAHRLGLPAAAVATNTLALDGKAYVLAVWHSAGVDGAYELAPLLELAEELGGQLLDGEVTRE